MFVVSVIEDKIKIVPELFDEDPVEVYCFCKITPFLILFRY